MSDYWMDKQLEIMSGDMNVVWANKRTLESLVKRVEDLERKMDALTPPDGEAK